MESKVARGGKAKAMYEGTLQVAKDTVSRLKVYITGMLHKLAQIANNKGEIRPMVQNNQAPNKLTIEGGIIKRSVTINNQF